MAHFEFGSTRLAQTASVCRRSELTERPVEHRSRLAAEQAI